MKPQWLKITLISIFFFLGTVSAGAMEENEVAAFTDFIKTLISTSSIQKNGAVCVMGSDEISSALALNDSKILNLDEMPEKFVLCKAIYIASGSEKALKLEIAKFSHNKIMTIGIFDNFVEMGGMTQVQMGRRNFELIVNAKAVKESNIKINSLLTNLIIN